MSTRLVILGLLRERPLYGYEIKHIIEDRMGDWTNIAFGSIYYALDKLEEEGLVEQVATEQEGGRPARTVYAITGGGRKAFLGLLREVWQDVERHYYTFDVGLTYMQALPCEEARQYLRQRIATLESILQHIEAHREEQLALEEVPRVAAAVFDHGLAHYEAELAWTRDLLDKVERGVYP